MCGIKKLTRLGFLVTILCIKFRIIKTHFVEIFIKELELAIISTEILPTPTYQTAPTGMMYTSVPGQQQGTILVYGYAQPSHPPFHGDNSAYFPKPGQNPPMGQYPHPLPTGENFVFHNQTKNPNFN